MAGTGVRLFLSGEVAYAADVNTYLMDQSICRFANSAARDAAFGDGIPVSQGGSGKPALSEGRFCYLDDINEVQFYNGSAWQAASQFAVGDGTITTEKIANNAITSDKIAPGVVIESDVADSAVTTSKIANAAVTADKIATAVAGSGLSGGAGTALAVNVDDSTIEISTDTLRIKDSGVTSAKLGSDLDLNGTTEIDEIIETVVINSTALTGTVHINAKSGAVHYFTSNSSGNWVWNFRGDGSTTLNSMLDTGQSMTFALFATNSTAYKPTSLTVDTTGTVSVKWFGGNAYPSGNASSVDCYTITIVKTAANTYTAFASQSKFA